MKLVAIATSLLIIVMILDRAVTTMHSIANTLDQVTVVQH